MILDLPPPLVVPAAPAIIRPVGPRLAQPGYLPEDIHARRAVVDQMIRSGAVDRREIEAIFGPPPFWSVEATTTAAPWNSADKGASLTLSNSDYDMTQSTGGAWDFARCLVGRSAGLKYFELEELVTGANGGYFGFCDTGPTHPSWPFGTSKAAGIRVLSSENFVTGWTKDWTGTPSGSLATDKYMVAINFTSGKAWIGRNGTWYNSGNPAAGTGSWVSGITGTVYPAASIFDLNGKIQIKTAAASMSYSIPSGFEAWDVN